MNVKEYVAYRKECLHEALSSLDRTPRLVIIQVNEDPASCAYVRGKLKDASEIGFDAVLDKQPIDIPESALLSLINKYNEDDTVDGIIVQLPLPGHINEDSVKLAVSPKKDVDGFHPMTEFDPCTPKGIVDYLSHEGYPFRGSNAVVVGRSNIVGKPMARLLTAKDCNVTTVHSKTSREDMDFYLAHADLIVVAVGKEAFIDHSYPIGKNAYIVDVGINRGEDGKLHGDVEADLDVRLQTPVPGGVGLLTRIALMENLFLAARGSK